MLTAFLIYGTIDLQTERRLKMLPNRGKEKVFVVTSLDWFSPSTDEKMLYITHKDEEYSAQDIKGLFTTEYTSVNNFETCIYEECNYSVRELSEKEIANYKRFVFYNFNNALSFVMSKHKNGKVGAVMSYPVKDAYGNTCFPIYYTGKKYNF